ncbi:MAG: hypothetical protein WCV73_04795 [Patescibacteria group bacterium]|jgi:hypothetical protein
MKNISATTSKLVYRSEGTILILVMVIVSALVLLINYFFSFVITEKKIAQSHTLATQTYYLTEAGIQEAIWKVNNDATWNNNFKSNPTWESSIIRPNPFAPNQSYQVAIKNSALGQATISATGTVTALISPSRRVVQTTIFQAQGQSPTSSLAIFSDRDINLSGVNLNIINASVFANRDIGLNFFTTLNVDKIALAARRIEISWLSALNSANKMSLNYPPAPAGEDMPQLDFNSSDPASLRNQADNYYTYQQFRNLISDSSNIVLNGLTYVDGHISIPRGKNITVNGALAANGNISIGTDFMPLWLAKPNVTVIDPGSGQVGLFAAGNFSVGSYTNSLNIQGLIYSNNNLNIDASGLTFSLTGGIVARDLSINSLWNSLTINYNEDLIFRTLGISNQSPVININHWEEEY